LSCSNKSLDNTTEQSEVEHTPEPKPFFGTYSDSVREGKQ
jgi:hypothetical protein